jgi:AraC-like DNA-binding protein
MWNNEKKAIIADYCNRKIVSSLMTPDLPETELAAEAEWRERNQQRHYRREAMFTLSGETGISLNGKTYLAVPGTLLLVNSREQHDRQYSPQTKQSSHIWMMIRPDFINCQGDEIKNGKFNVDFQYIYRNADTIKRLNFYWDAAESQKISPQIALFCIVTLLNLVFVDLLQESEKLNMRVMGITPQAQAIDKVKSYLDSTCGRHCNIDSLSKMAGYSSMHFQRLFRQFVKMSVGQYINLLRSRRYEEMKINCSQKIIAEELGFASSSALCNWLQHSYQDYSKIASAEKGQGIQKEPHKK